ncbi:MAG: hypothetical protein EA361_05405 [Bacteroidetes bacterium]|nr:MAG: hypothetical protein EA361_05405 [Bacteroidota bacterium]
MQLLLKPGNQVANLVNFSFLFYSQEKNFLQNSSPGFQFGHKQVKSPITIGYFIQETPMIYWLNS